MPKVSISVPNLNTRPYLPERFETVFDQTFQDWELVVCDSYSDDGSWEFQETRAHAGKGTDGEYRKELDRLIAELPTNCRVNMVDHVSLPELQVLLRNHAIFAFPVTWDEPFSLTLLEAMHAGIAIVSTATGGSKEVLRHDENALVVERNDADDLAAALDTLLTDEQLRRRLGANAQASVLPFDLDKTLDRVEQHLQSALNDSQSA
jgi:glycosyltransferase involved in cell wall biosynthesis